eukprot:TRINITY_DN1004_c0_g3_i2.p1 TRINITY_DN1004_c0_g3~~TRINITY_DN1004_c0_g3_i2.p1  ORF type:complete len:114 (+),score=16.73 TRINITY_DN1004_c0_g3_i2:203-544(+)
MGIRMIFGLFVYVCVLMLSLHVRESSSIVTSINQKNDGSSWFSGDVVVAQNSMMDIVNKVSMLVPTNPANPPPIGAGTSSLFSQPLVNTSMDLWHGGYGLAKTAQISYRKVIL